MSSRWSIIPRAWRRLLRIAATAGVPRVKPRVLREFAHDPGAFTQGLALADDVLYESTGLAEESSLRALDPRDGRVLRKIPVPGVWAEGIAVRGERLVQLTWKAGQAYCYRLPDLERIGSVAFEGEGWGLTAAADGFLMTDGTARITRRDDDFAVVGTLRAASRGLSLKGLNDLAYCRGRLYAAVHYRPELFELDAVRGRLLRIVDCRELTERAGPRSHHHVLNGVACDEATGSLYVTGKHWPRMFEISIA